MSNAEDCIITHMRFKEPLIRGKLLRRYKRFLADVELENGSIVTAHCTNSGSMKTCLEYGAPVLLSKANNSNRKTRYTWEMIFINGGWVGINTMIPNIIAVEMLKNSSFPGLTGYRYIKSEVNFYGSRLDILAEGKDGPCLIEVKNVTLKNEEYALFPDAVTKRGLKHLDSLIESLKHGFRAIMLYVIQRTDVKLFSPATAIDPKYSERLLEAYRLGVEIIPIQVHPCPTGIEVKGAIPFKPPPVTGSLKKSTL